MITTIIITVIVAGSQLLTTNPDSGPGPRPADVAGSNATPYTPASKNISDSYQRYVRTGLGTAPLGGAYLTSANGVASVSSGAVRLSGMRPGATWTSSLRSMRAQNELMQIIFAVKSLPTRGNGIYVGVEMRRQTSGDAYRARVHVLPGGVGELSLRRQTGDDDATSLRIVRLPFRIHTNKPVVLQSSISDATGGPNLRARAWALGSATPGWQVDIADVSRSAIDHTGLFGICAYLSRGTSAIPVAVYHLDGWQLARAGTGAHPSTSHSAPASKPASSKPAASSTKPAPPKSTSHGSPSGTHSSTTKPAPSSSAPRTSHSSSTAPPAASGSTPGSGNTGVPYGTKLTVHNGNLEVKKAGQVVSGLDVRGFIIIEAANITIKNTIVRGGPMKYDSIGMIDATWPSAKNLTVQDVELAPTHPASGIDGVKGKSFTVRRADIHGVIDGIKVLGSSVSVYDSWIHNLSTMPHDPHQNGGPSHSDGIQVEGGSNFVFRNNNIMGGYNSGLQVTTDVSVVHNLTLDHNVLGGGSCTVNVSQKPRPGVTGMTIADNRFTKTSTAKCGIIMSRGIGFSAARNYYAASSSPYGALASEPVKIVLR